MVFKNHFALRNTYILSTCCQAEILAAHARAPSKIASVRTAGGSAAYLARKSQSRIDRSLSGDRLFDSIRSLDARNDSRADPKGLCFP